MSDETPTKRAEFILQSGSQEHIPVQFNPVSLQLSITNTLEEKGKDKKQYVSKSTAKLAMDLIFDTTHSGQDVRIDTEKIANLMKPDEQNNAPPVVLFDWGTFKFKGMVDSYKETIDFFSPSGVPLRASVNLSLTQQEKVFDSNRNPDGAPPPEPVEAFTPQGESVTDVAARGGSPGASRALAAANGLESIRFPGGAVSVSASVSLGGPVAFASGGASLSASIGGGIGISGGIGAGISGGAGIGGGISGGAGIGGGLGVGMTGGAGITGSFSAGISGGASAGISATEGAFAGLRSSTDQRSSFSLNTSRLTQRNQSLSVATDSGATFSVGGQASLQGSASLSADVGASTSLRARIQFEE